MPSESIEVGRKHLATKKKLIGDVTRTARAKAHLDRLGDAKGKRLVVDLDAPGREALEVLLESGYGQSQKEVVIKALMTASAKLRKKP